MQAKIIKQNYDLLQLIIMKFGPGKKLPQTGKIQELLKSLNSIILLLYFVYNFMFMLSDLRVNFLEFNVCLWSFVASTRNCIQA